MPLFARWRLKQRSKANLVWFLKRLREAARMIGVDRYLYGINISKPLESKA
jgi:hypothetical protein